MSDPDSPKKKSAKKDQHRTPPKRKDPIKSSDQDPEISGQNLHPGQDLADVETSPSTRETAPESAKTPNKRGRWRDHPTFGLDMESVVLTHIAPAASSHRDKKTPDSADDDQPSPHKRKKLHGKCVVIFASEALETWGKNEQLAPWMIQRIGQKKNEWTLWTLDHGPRWVVLVDRKTCVPSSARAGKAAFSGEIALSEAGPYAAGRELGGQLHGALAEYAVTDVTFEWVGFESVDQEALADCLNGLFAGLELGAYRFKNIFQGPLPPLPRISLPHEPHGWSPDRAAKLALATNLARHLVNLPPNVLHPETYAQCAQELFAGSRRMSVDIWDHRRLQKERCHLICAVGGASEHGPALVHLRYRPREKKTSTAGTEAKSSMATETPLVFVAKGITFDSGGLNIKDSGSMRLMKKDMGGSAAALALAWWVHLAELPLACDFYLALAENAIGSRAFRPGDIITSRAGITVEIDNTDAEGRLVLADAIDVALEHYPRTKLMVNFATLTGAMRVALGTKVAGYFATDKSMASLLEKAALASGEPVWQMPLYPEYRSQLKSHVSDLANSGPQRFGGAISAALFLQRFVGHHPWIHVDHYAWNEGAGGGTSEPGGSGQMVQLFAEFLQSFVKLGPSG